MRSVILMSGLAAALVVAGLSSTVAAQDVLSAPVFTDVTSEALALDSKFLRKGTNVPLSRILSVQQGQSETQVRQSLGQPAAVSTSNDGTTWEYHFSLPLDKGRDSLVCQFIVKFNGATHLTEETHWRRRQCQALAGTAVNLSADVLFSFDQDTLSATGKAALDGILAGLPKQDGPFSVSVVGYTDRLGDAAYNQRLSERRAVSAADYLVSRGVSSGAMRAYGKGAAEPLVMCEGNQPNAALKECLAPNRRISVQIKAASY